MSDADIAAAADRLYRESNHAPETPGGFFASLAAGMVPATVAAAAPMLMRGVNAAATAGEKAMSAKHVMPAVAGYEAAKDLAKGDVKGAAETAGAAYAVPKALRAVANATAPMRKGIER